MLVLDRDSRVALMALAACALLLLGLIALA